MTKRGNAHGRRKWIRHAKINRDKTSLQRLLKGILTAEDAVLAVEHGIDGIIVSNHGGRQLDSVQASIEALPEVVEAAGQHCEIYLDSGIRRGTDVLLVKLP